VPLAELGVLNNFWFYRMTLICWVLANPPMSDVSFGIRARTQFKWAIMMRTFCGVTVIKVWPKRDKNESDAWASCSQTTQCYSIWCSYHKGVA
jgi:hypothetical protein